MAVPNNKSDDALLKNLVPLNTLSEQQLGQLLSRIVIQKARRGDYLFREGDSDHQNIYLLSGTVALLSGQKEMDLVSSGTQTARFALAHQLPRKHSARAKNEVTYVCIDSRMLSDMLARSQTESYQVNESESAEKSDWMSLLLRSPVFQQIPPANLQRVMMRMKRVSVSADQTIIQQGDEGDYFYLISRGVCRVSRQPEADHPPVELAQLKAGQGFGEEALISEKPRSSTVTMITDGELVRLSKRDFVELVKQPLSRAIDYPEASGMIDEGALWVDVRIPEEYDAGHLPEAINLPFFSLRFQASSLASDRVYLIYGAEVGQSATAAYLLVERGYEVFMLSEGWSDIAPQAGLEHYEVEAQANNVIDFNRESESPEDCETEQLESENKHLTRDLQHQLATAKHKFEEKLAQYQTEQRLLKQALSAAKRKLEGHEKDAVSTREALTEEVARLRAELADGKDLQHERESSYQESERILKEQLAELEKQLSDLQLQLQEANADAREVNDESSQLDARLQQERNEHAQAEADLQGQVDTLKQQLEEVSAAQQKQLHEASVKAEESSQSIASLEEKLQSVLAESEQFQIRVAQEHAALEEQREKLQQDYDSVKALNETREKEAQEQITAIKRELENSESGLKQLETEKENLLQEQGRLKSEVVELNSQVELRAEQQISERNTLEQQIQKLQDERVALEDELVILRQSSDAAGSEYQVLIDHLKAELDKAQGSIAELNQANQQDRAERNDAESRLNAALSEASRRADEFELELSSVRTAQAAAETEYLRQIAGLEDELEEAVRHQVELEEVKLTLNESLGDMEQVIAQEKVERENLASALKEAAHGNEQLSKQLAGLEGELTQEQQAKREIEDSYKALQQHRTRLEKELDDIRKAGDDADARHQKLLNSLQFELDEARTSLTELNQSHQQQQAERDEAESTLNSALSEAAEQVERLESELTAARQSLESAESDLTRQVADLELQLQSAQQDSDEKTISLQQTASEISELSEKYIQLERQFAQEQTAVACLSQDLEDKKRQLEDIQQEYAEQQQKAAEADAEHAQTLNGLQEKLATAETEALTNSDALSEIRIELKKLDEQRITLAARLEEEQHNADFLKRSLATAEDAIEISEGALQERSGQFDTLKTQLEALETDKRGLEQRLQELLDNQNERENAFLETERSYRETLEQTNKELAAARSELEKARAEEIEREAGRNIQLEVLQAEKSEIEIESAESQNRLQAKLQAFEVSTAEQQQYVQRLERELSALQSELGEMTGAKGEAQDSAEALQAAQQEIARLTKNIDGLREVQLEMETQLSDGSEEEILKLRSELELEEKKRRSAEELARQADVLRRERAIQETAVEMLGEDLDSLAREKKQLEEDNKVLERRLSELRGEFSELMNENNHLHTEMSEFRGQVDDSHMADDLLVQVEELRIKSDIFEQERDNARSESNRMKREVHELAQRNRDLCGADSGRAVLRGK